MGRLCTNESPKSPRTTPQIQLPYRTGAARSRPSCSRMFLTFCSVANCPNSFVAVSPGNISVMAKMAMETISRVTTIKLRRTVRKCNMASVASQQLFEKTSRLGSNYGPVLVCGFALADFLVLFGHFSLVPVVDSICYQFSCRCLTGAGQFRLQRRRPSGLDGSSAEGRNSKEAGSVAHPRRSGLRWNSGAPLAPRRTR